MRPFMHELRLAARSLRKRPGFAAIVALTLALALGANVAIFAVVNAVLIRPLPFPEPERIVWVRHHAPGLDIPMIENSQGTLRLYAEHARGFSHFGAMLETRRNLTGGVQPARVEMTHVTPSLFGVLGVVPALGRPFVDADAEPGAPPVTVLTYGGWSALFGRAPDVLGRTVELDGVPTEIVGVMPRGFAYPVPETAGLLPYRIEPDGSFPDFGMVGIGRLAPGVTLEAARAEVTQLQPRLSEMFSIPTPEFLDRAGWSASVTPMREIVIGDAAKGLWVVLGTVAFLLLVAVASVASLFLVRAESRQREVGVRLALGATWRRVASAFLAESLLLGMAGGVLGVGLAAVGLRALVAAGPPHIPRLHEIGLDAGVLAFAAALSVVAGVVLGLLPVGAHLRGAIAALSRQGRGVSASRDRQRTRKLLIVAQIALALVLLTGAGLMLRTYDRLRAVDPGIRPDGVLTVGVSLGEHRERRESAAAMMRIMDAVAALPGVSAVGATNAMPVRPNPGEENGGTFHVASDPRAPGELLPFTMFAVATGAFFEALGIRLVEGRTIERADAEFERRVVWVNETVARTLLNDRALGERIRFARDAEWYDVVGVVGDVRAFGLREEPRPFVYLPMMNDRINANLAMMHLMLRTDGDPTALGPAVRRVVEGIVPDAPITTAKTMRAVVDESMADTSFTMSVLLVAGTIALLLGAVGLYGVIGYVVSQRTQELGVRMALGAPPARVRRMVLGQALALAVTGIALGLAGALALSRAMEGLLFGIDARDPLTFIATPVVLFAIAAIAAYLPARRASAVSPVEALREL